MKEFGKLSPEASASFFHRVDGSVFLTASLPDSIPLNRVAELAELFGAEVIDQQ